MATEGSKNGKLDDRSESTCERSQGSDFSSESHADQETDLDGRSGSTPGEDEDGDLNDQIASGSEVDIENQIPCVPSQHAQEIQIALESEFANRLFMTSRCGGEHDPPCLQDSSLLGEMD